MDVRFSAFVGFGFHIHADYNFRIFCPRFRPFALNDLQRFGLGEHSLHQHLLTAKSHSVRPTLPSRRQSCRWWSSRLLAFVASLCLFQAIRHVFKVGRQLDKRILGVEIDGRGCKKQTCLRTLATFPCRWHVCRWHSHAFVRTVLLTSPSATS